ncbi:MAG: RNA methyltransferase [Bacteroidetes bacterium]|nr:RNA methyltransferase [Bacteroidota bacterium]
MLSKSTVKYIQSLGHKKFRDEEGLFLAEGPKIVKELINEIPALIQSIYCVEDWLAENRNLPEQIKVNIVSESELERLSQLTVPNKVLAVVKKINTHTVETKDKITIALDTIQDPGNMGTIIRTADWFGIDQVVCSTDSAEIYNPKVVQSTMGSIARVKVIYTDLKEWMQEQNVKKYAAALDGDDIKTIEKIKEGIIIIGNESKGIHPDILKIVSEKITISKTGKAESLNAAVAAGIIMAQLRS